MDFSPWREFSISQLGYLNLRFCERSSAQRNLHLMSLPGLRPFVVLWVLKSCGRWSEVWGFARKEGGLMKVHR